MSPEFTWASDRALRVRFAERDSDDVHARLMGAYEALVAQRPQGTIDVTAAYATLLITFSSPAINHAACESAVRRAVASSASHPSQSASRIIEVPCCYDVELAPDLQEVADVHGLARDEVIAMHSAATYRVRFLGFSPGFPYMTGLPVCLETPRLPTPRTRVPAGSVAIAGAQAGIYPQATPGGWRILGRTPLAMLDTGSSVNNSPCLLAIGDRVRFRPISRAEFDAIHAERGGAS